MTPGRRYIVWADHYAPWHTEPAERVRYKWHMCVPLEPGRSARHIRFSVFTGPVPRWSKGVMLEYK